MTLKDGCPYGFSKTVRNIRMLKQRLPVFCDQKIIILLRVNPCAFANRSVYWFFSFQELASG